ncbi:hypothetical protein [Microbacterium sp. Clip185]|uniref:hypothetical protein n=1 Tax=Microbacterium sp. Clip185 TaxID=3025663 RepID=UPI002366F708|nr:hypothetical protein [Microbacterium sp. Clip185]WDG19394.1 hypothetical protein PQV94_06545 [Microbacterium sp. Clip185]
MDVDFGQLELAGQVLERQRGHAEAIGQHLETYARLNAGELGLILQLFKPISDGIVDAGVKVTDLSAQVFRTGTDRMAETVSTYRNAEQSAYQAAAQVSSALGMSLAPYAPGQAPALGAPQSAASSRYGEPDGNVFNQAFWDGYSAAEWVDETVGDTTSRIGDGLSSSRTVTEAVDVRSYLPVPRGEDPEIESIRWKAGPIFGGVDWLFEQLVGYSLLEEVTKPFSGDWERMREAQFAWTHAGDAMSGIGRNAMALLPPMATWTGKGSEAFAAAAAVVSQAHTVIAGPAGTISTSIKALILLCKEVVGWILKLLDRLSKKLLRMAAEASFPVAGWIIAAGEAGLMVYELIQDARKAYKWINMIYDLVSGMTSGLGAIVDNGMRMADLYEGLARGAAARVS